VALPRISRYPGMARRRRSADVCEFWSRRGAAREPAAGETIPGFNDVYKGTIEWRLERSRDGKLKPFATILCWNFMTSPDDRQTSGRKLVITKLGPGGVCHVGYVDAAPVRTPMNSQASLRMKKRVHSSAESISLSRWEIVRRISDQDAGDRDLRRSRRKLPCRAPCRQRLPTNAPPPGRRGLDRIEPRARCRRAPKPPGSLRRFAEGPCEPR
jgi:hypothetical protein